VVLSDEKIAEIRAKLTELPEARRDRFVNSYGLALYDANLLTATKVAADYFETCLKTEALQGIPLTERAKAVSNWLLGEFNRLLNATNSEIDKARVTPEQLSRLINLVLKNTISGTNAKEVFEEMFQTGKTPDEIISQRGLSQISDTGAIEAAVAQVISNNPQPVLDYKAGKAQAMTFLVGQVMRLTKGRANAKLVNELMKKKLEEG